MHLRVKGIPDMLKSFEDYCEVETLDGDNQYRAEGHGMQNAKKGVIFEEFPPVLNIQLRRFEYVFENAACNCTTVHHESARERERERERGR